MNKFVKNAKDEKESEKINMLLDIEHFYGEHEGRLAPVIIALCLGLSPILIYVYFGLFQHIPVWLFIPVEIVIALRVIMIIPGREKYRVEMFRRQIHDEYTTTSNLLNIKTIHPDGCVEFVNGEIMYLVTAYNGTITDDIRHTIEVRKFMQSLIGDYAFDIKVFNIESSASLNDYYQKISKFDRNESADNFVKIIDYSKSLVEEQSRVQCILFCIKGKRSDWKDIRKNIDNTLNSKLPRCYKTVTLLESVQDINEIINRDIDTVINIPDLLRRKYKTGEYETSRVLKYDASDTDILQLGQDAEHAILPKANPHSFHVNYDDVMNPKKKKPKKKKKRVKTEELEELEELEEIVEEPRPKKKRSASNSTMSPAERLKKQKVSKSRNVQAGKYRTHNG